ncbi:bifunctional metallophosphatase/5'-nucleotidase [Pinisolibacter aquiterrae]|uniref:bifunctional metallophosphatase/5'-nucleotidase n=1 Tax=Pinisolibacter aquiterrae TaxID=2815579 RepID=UPI001C3E0A02|nr:bifunctional metallophosphatase/5'-nucleotidase [Pinisolibacter aquiterrae]MBV5264137.1 bifunctional metallophosphatase/5'-nucleotidase [Pinisolibacter aquiterrae]MCC8233769.1 bifunctional metallophosphatase/5'-nucleotidase [Pinisolibacter aquiterrae]
MKLAPSLLVLGGLATALSTTTIATAADLHPLEVKLLAINDFHGNLKSPGGIKIKDPADPTKTISVPAGGSEAMATLVKEKRASAKHSVFVAAGDLIGASPLLSALFADEPTIESLSAMGLEVSAVGNHEFDKGVGELLRKQNGGCQSDKACLALHPFVGAKFKYLAASTTYKDSGKTIFPAYEIKTFEGISIAFVGLALKGTPDIVLPSGVAGVEFHDEAATVNALIPELKAKGIESVVVLIHEGGFPTGDYDECPGISGPIVDIVKKLDPAVKVVVSGHTHKAYNCAIDGKLVTSGDKFGTVVTDIDLKIDHQTRQIVEAKAHNVIVRTDTYAKDPEQTALIAAYEKVAGPLIERPVGKIAATLPKAEAPSGEIALGDIIADAQLAATKAADKGAAVIAVTNPGGIRADLVKKREDGTVTYGDIFAVQPFSNNLVTLTLTGEELDTMLEQQWQNQPKPRILQISKGFSYTWSEAKPAGEKVDIASITLDGKPIDPKASYRVTVNNFLADGGDGFKVFRKAKDQLPGIFDVDALEDYLKTAGLIEAPKLDRIVKAD